MHSLNCVKGFAQIALQLLLVFFDFVFTVLIPTVIGGYYVVGDPFARAC